VDSLCNDFGVNAHQYVYLSCHHCTILHMIATQLRRDMTISALRELLYCNLTFNNACALRELIYCNLTFNNACLALLLESLMAPKSTTESAMWSDDDEHDDPATLTLLLRLLPKSSSLAFSSDDHPDVDIVFDVNFELLLLLLDEDAGGAD
jgi:hypothetical protein